MIKSVGYLYQASPKLNDKSLLIQEHLELTEKKINLRMASIILAHCSVIFRQHTRWLGHYCNCRESAA